MSANQTTVVAGEVTERVAEAFGLILDMPAADIPPDATLTSLGADSLGMGQICARLGTMLGRPVPLSQIFRTPTVRGLAAWLDGPGRAPRADVQGADVPGADVAGHRSSIPPGAARLSVMQGHMFVRHMFSPDDRTMNCVRTWRLAGQVDRTALRASLEHVHREHPMLSSTYRFRGTPYVLPGSGAPHRLRELESDSESGALAALNEEAARPFDLVRGEIWRSTLVSVRGEPVSLFGFCVHHVAYDAGSAGILTADIAAAYNAFRSGAKPRLRAAPTPVLIAELREAHAAYVDPGAQADYWRETVEGIPAVIFPAGEPPANGSTARPADAPVRMLQRVLPVRAREVTEAAAAYGVSPFVLYLSAYAQALAAVSGQRDFGIGVPVNRRADAELFDAVSCIMDILCLRLRPDPNAGGAEAVASTAAVTRAAFAAQDVSVFTVGELIGATPAAQRNPLFQTMFVLQDNDQVPLGLDGLDVRFFRPDYPGAASELVAEVWPAAGPDDSPRLLLCHQPERVSPAFCAELSGEFSVRLTAHVAGGARPPADRPATGRENGIQC